jgi:hypothetical protein
MPHAHGKPGIGSFLTSSGKVKLCGTQRILATLSDYTNAAFSDIPRLREEFWFSLGKVTDYIMIYYWQVIGFLTENGETEI